MKQAVVRTTRRWRRQGRRLLGRTMRELFPATVSMQLSEALRRGWAADEPDAYCHRCGASAGPGAQTPRGCAFCLRQSLPWQRVVRLSAYREPVSDWLVTMKFGRAWPWANWFGTALAQRVGEPFQRDRVAVCPVPMHWLRRCGRGYNQAALIAEALARARDWPFCEILHRARYTPPQTAIAPSQRGPNVRGSFVLRRPLDLSDWELWLVDDIKTTGATATACAKLLRDAGARCVNLAVVAVADPRHADFKMI